MTRDVYADLFNARGHQYHAAMLRYPHVRDAEFELAVNLSGVRPGERVADIPCGGGYLAGYLPAGVELYSVDSSDVFADCFRRSANYRLLQCPITDVPLPAGSLDRVISVAGLHHVRDRRTFWSECARLLRPGGTLTVCDVRANSRVSRFLDSVVDRYTTTGHSGIYFNEATSGEIEASGFGVTDARPNAIPWCAPNRTVLAEFCRLLFGLEGIDCDELLPLLASHVGVYDYKGGFALSWELMSYRATRR